MKIQAKSKAEIAEFEVDDDFAYLSRWKWKLSYDGYACRNVKIDGRWQTLFVHRIVMGVEPGDPRIVDHIDRNKLNCTRNNLRFVTKQQSNFNTCARANSKSPQRGVSWRKRSNRWEVQFQKNGLSHYVGSSVDHEEAVQMAKVWLKNNTN